MTGRPSDPDPTEAARTIKANAIDPLETDGANLPGETDTIGPYRILQRVGEGGMGVVYEAEQKTPVRRRVALKVVKRGMDTREVVARFESERQALALMDHPNIAKVFDAGSTERGRPYFVMEFVAGIPITEYCDKHKLTTPERLALFRTVCGAIQHAHTKGIIHRDIKPGNVLVAFQDGKPTPKVIDFGVAKATEQRLTELTVFTELGQLIGTPEYMSPELAEMSGLDVDTRTDVYSLGVLLYELMTGALPFDSKKLRQSGFDGLLRTIREEDPPRPSTRTSTLGDRLSDVARNRGTDPRSLSRQIRGDLDWVVMRALEKDRSRRYASAAALADDVGRHLDNEPVSACPPSTRYRMSKFVRRHRVGVAAATAVLLALMLGVMGTTVGLVRAKRSESRAQRDAATAEQVSSFLADLFDQANPWTDPGDIVSAEDLLDRGTERIERQLQDQALVKQELLSVIAESYAGLQQWGKANALADQVLAMLAIHPVPRLEASALITRGRCAHMRDHFEEAVSDYSKAAATLEREGMTDTREYHMARARLGLAVSETDPEKGAEILLGRLREVEAELASDPDPPEWMRGMEAVLQGYLGSAYQTAGDLDAAAEHYEKAVALYGTLGTEGPMSGSVLYRLGRIYDDRGDYESAEAYYRRTYELQFRLYGDSAPLHDIVSDLASVLRHLGREVEATALDARFPGRVESPSALNSTGYDMYLRGEAGADSLFARALMILDAGDASETRLAAFVWQNRALNAHTQGDPASAQVYYGEAVRIREAILDSQDVDLGWSLYGLGLTAYLTQDREEAIRAFSRAMGPAEAAEKAGVDGPPTLTIRLFLAELFSQNGRYAEALDLLDSYRPEDMSETNQIVYGFAKGRSQKYLGDDIGAKGTLGAVLELMSRPGGDAVAVYTAACVLALLNRPEEAMVRLRASANMGYANVTLLEDADLNTLWNEPGFVDLVAQVIRNSADQ